MVDPCLNRSPPSVCCRNLSLSVGAVVCAACDGSGACNVCLSPLATSAGTGTVAVTAAAAAAVAAAAPYVPPSYRSPPIITMLPGAGGSPPRTLASGGVIVTHSLLLGAAWKDPGCAAVDAVDGDISAHVTVRVGATGPVSTVAVTPSGQPFIMSYSVVDGGGLSAPPAQRSITVVNPCTVGEVPCFANGDGTGGTTGCSSGGVCSVGAIFAAAVSGVTAVPRTPPSVTLTGSAVVFLPAGSSYDACPTDSPVNAVCDRGAVAQDTLDGVLTPSLAACARNPSHPQPSEDFQHYGLNACRFAFFGNSSIAKSGAPWPGPAVYTLNLSAVNSAGMVTTVQRTVTVSAGCAPGESLCLNQVCSFSQRSHEYIHFTWKSLWR